MKRHGREKKEKGGKRRKKERRNSAWKLSKRKNWLYRRTEREKEKQVA